LEAPDNNGTYQRKYQSSPITINGDQGNCELAELIPPGQYRLLLHILALRAEVLIPPTPHAAVALHMNISPGRILIFADQIVRNEQADNPQTTPIQLDASNRPVVLSRVEPEYAPNAMWARISGNVRVEAVVNEKGEVYEAKLLTGDPFFDQPALNAVVQWRFQPMLVNGEPKPFVTTETLTFLYWSRK
jgi:TonB family protein